MPAGSVFRAFGRFRVKCRTDGFLPSLGAGEVTRIAARAVTRKAAEAVTRIVTGAVTRIAAGAELPEQ